MQLYASDPVQRTRQLAADLGLLAWFVLWVLVARVVHGAVLVLAEPGLRLQAGLGRTTGRGFLSLCETGAERRCALVWLGPALPGRTVVPSKIRAVGPALWRRNRTLLVDGEER